MDLKLRVVILPVADVDRAKDFYVDRAGFRADYDAAPNEYFRIVQLTPPGSEASIAIGTNLTHSPAEPGSAQGMRLVVEDIEQARRELVERGVDVTPVDDRAWGRFAWFTDPDGNGWELNEAAAPAER